MGGKKKSDEAAKGAKALEDFIALSDKYTKTNALALDRQGIIKSSTALILGAETPEKAAEYIKKRDAALAAVDKQVNSANKPEGKTEAQRQLEKDQEVVRDLTNATKDLNAEYNNKEDSLKRQLKLGVANGGIDKARYDLLQKELMEQQPALLKQKALEKKTNEEIKKIQEDYLQTVQKISEYNNETRDENTRLDYRLEVLGKTEEQIKAINQERDKEIKLAKAKDVYDKQLLENGKNPMTQFDTDAKAYQAYTDRVRAINRETAVQLKEEYNAAFKEVTDFLRDVLSIAIFEGGEAGTKKLKDKVQDIFRNKITLEIEAVVNAFIADVVGINGKGEATGASGSLGERFDKFADKLTSKDSIFTKEGFSNNIAGKIDKAGDFFTKLGDTSETLGEFGGYLKNNSKELGKYAQQAGDALNYLEAASNFKDGSYGKSIGQAVGTAYFGPIGGEVGKMIGSLVDQVGEAFKRGFKGEYVQSLGETVAKITGSTVNLVGSGGNNDVSIGGGLDIRQTKMSDSFTKDLATAFITASNNLGITGTNVSFGAGFNNSDGGKFAIETTANGKKYDPGQFKNTDENLKLEATRAVFFALQSSELPTYLKGVFDNLVASTASSQEITAALEYAQALKQINSQLQAVSLQGLGNLDYKQLDALVNKSGGASSLASNLSSYYENFLTEEEKKAATLKNIKQVLDKAGGTFSVAELAKLDRVAFKNLLNTISPDSDLYAALLSVNGAIAGITSPLEDAGAAFKDLGKTIEEEVARIRGDILGTGPEAQANAQTAFTIATAQARAGDAEAAANLPELSKNLLKFAENNASTLQELNQIRAATANSLAATAAIVKSFGIAPVTTGTTVGSSTGGTTAPTNPVIGAPVYNPSTDLSSPLFVGPRPLVASNATTGNYGDNGNTEVLIALEAVASMTNKNYKLLDGVINGENNLRVSVYAP